MNAYHRITRVILMGVLLTFALGTPAAFGAAILGDNYPESNTDVVLMVEAAYPQIGQSFTAIGGALDSVTFDLVRAATSVGSAHALLYAHSGTFGVDGVPSGPPLATSSPVDVATITASGERELVTFHFGNAVRLTAGEKYVIAFRYLGSAEQAMRCGADGSTPTHPGNFSYLSLPSTWVPMPTYDGAFYVYETPFVPVYRFYNAGSGTHFYTANETEKANVQNTLGHIFAYEGVAYSLNPANNTTPLYRFFKPSTGTHFYTASETEKTNVQNTLGNLYTYEGPAYNVSADDGGGTKLMVWRFYNRLNGTHFYTADPGEKATVETTLGHIYTLDGPAFYLGQ